MQWKEEFSVGVDAFDQDHKILFDLVNQFEIAGTTGKSDEHIVAVLETLVDYTKTHFK
ncbi:MAG: hemerythrin, partial [Rhodospirillales bacterium]|nr:hemerythrin [Rhodospirillales bacterium]